MSLWSLELRLVVRGAEGDARAAVERGVAQPVPGVQVVPAAAVVVTHEVTGSWPRVPQRRAGQHPGRGHRVLQQPSAVSEPAVSVVYLLEMFIFKLQNTSTNDETCFGKISLSNFHIV